MEYYVYLTNDCNLSCSYCSAIFDCKKKGIPLKPQYGTDDFIRFVNKTQTEQNDDEAVIIFFGGEPTLEFERMQSYINAFSAQAQPPYTVRYVLHTNGVLLNTLPKPIAQALDMIILSINYDLVPRYGLGDGYYAQIIKNVQALKQYKNLTITARLTISEQSSLYTLLALTQNHFDKVHWQIVNCADFEDFKAYYTSYTFEVGLAFEQWLTELEKGNLLMYIPFLSVLREMVQPTPNLEHFCCSYESSQVYLQTNGDVYSCCDNVADGVKPIGNMQDGFVFKHCKWTAYKRCNECKYNAICRGRCGRMHLEFNDNHIDEYCQLNLFMFELFEKNKDRLMTAFNAHEELHQQFYGWQIDIMELTP